MITGRMNDGLSAVRSRNVNFLLPFRDIAGTGSNVRHLPRARSCELDAEKVK